MSDHSAATERLYYDDSYTLTFDAHIIERTTYHDQPAVVLDRSYFYPEGGGQPNDTGTLNGVRVIDVQTRESDRAVLHVLAAPLNADGNADSVQGIIDGDRRRDLRVHHSGQHILSQALSQAAHAETISVHMSLDSMTIDVSRGVLSADEVRAVETLANRVVTDDRAVHAWFPTPDELTTIKLRKLPDVSGKLRVVDMDGFDVTACGGTHVARTGEIGLIKIIRLEKRGNGTRIEFKCGERALADYRDKNELINRLAVDLSTGFADLPDSVARLREEVRALRAELKPLRDQALDSEAHSLLANVVMQGGCRVVLSVFEARDPEHIKTLAQKIIAIGAIATPPDTLVLFGVAGDKAQLIFACTDNAMLDGVPLNVVPLLKTALKTLGSDRGGGRPNFAQGGGLAADRTQIAVALQAAAAQIGLTNLPQ